MPVIFVYGPDSFRARVFDRVGSCEVMGAASLEGQRLVFNKPNMKNRSEGFANLEEADGETVYGVLFDMSRKQQETFEGYYGGYATKPVKVNAKKLQTDVDALAFVARRTAKNLGPSKANIDLTIQGAEENSLPRDFLDHLRGLKPIDE